MSAIHRNVVSSDKTVIKTDSANLRSLRLTDLYTQVGITLLCEQMALMHT